MMKQFDHMIERNVFPRLKFLTGCGQFSDFSNICPLLSIVDDQIKEAKDLGITACRLKDFLEEETSKIDFTVTQLAHIMKYMSFSYVNRE